MENEIKRQELNQFKQNVFLLLHTVNKETSVTRFFVYILNRIPQRISQFRKYHFFRKRRITKEELHM